MSCSRTLLVVAHAPSPNTRKLREAVERGACHEDIENVRVKVLAPLDAGPEDVLACDAIILGTTENLGYMSGALKDFFDRTYYAVLEKTQGLPFSFYIRAGHDGTGTHRAIESITTGLRWRLVQKPLLCRGDYRDEFEDQCQELGLYLAAGLDAGLF
ncbi:flavodoxin family protein [Marinobacter sp.]|uniref:flavodoxin family protein n=1 Tax=Marinobacter sp. TaxID=50741 RepID=UPI002B46393F|nr:flavodoxin family protein [Marinobacter sp.]HKK56236.1 flavodoxin family protein [Marinobacter sp.]